MERLEADRARRLEALIARKREDLAARRATTATPTAKDTRIVAAAGLVAAFAAWLTGLSSGPLGGLERTHLLLLGVALGLLVAGYQKLRAGRRNAKDEGRPDGASALMLCLTVALLGVSLAGTVLGDHPILP